MTNPEPQQPEQPIEQPVQSADPYQAVQPAQPVPPATHADQFQSLQAPAAQAGSSQAEYGQTQPAQTQPVQHTQPTVPLTETGSQTPYPGAVYAPHPSHMSVTAQPGYTAEQPNYAVGQPLPEPPAFEQSVFEQSAFEQPATAQPERQSRVGVWIAGIAIGAVLGGIVGGGASALVLANQPTPTVVQPQSGSITLENLSNATSVSAVAAVGAPSVVTLEVSSSTAAGSGSGVVYSEDGYIVTNAHVVLLDGAAGSNPSIRVWLTDGRILDGEVVGVDPFADIAVVKVDADGLTPIALADSSDVVVGDLAVAIGAPLNLSNTVTSGVVSALNRGISVGTPIIPDENDDQTLEEPGTDGELPWYRFGNPNESGSQTPSSAGTRVTLPVIQTDASINPGNSGGALLNSNAELIGINVAIASQSTSSGTAGSVGLGFAIPVNLVTRVADAIIAGEQPSHGLLGVSVGDSSSDTDNDRNIAGALISEVVPGGAAAAGGLRVGDVIIAVDGIPADSGTTASALVRMHEGGSEVTITYTRNGVRGETTVTLGTLDW